MNEDIAILACTLIGEARGEPIEGIVAVASVIRNRVQLKWQGRKTYYDVCISPLQFSCWNPDDPNYVLITELLKALNDGKELSDIYFRQCMVVADAIVNWNFRDNTNGATNYLTTILLNSIACPRWAKGLKVTAVRGNHSFLVSK